MPKGIILSLLLILCQFIGIAYAQDSFDFNEFAVVAGEGDIDLTAEDVELNSGADVASVGGFDIAGIMLGMTFDDVYGLFFQNKGLYAPKKTNSVIYTLDKNWKYNLDYECRQQGTYIPTELEKCINSLAKNRGLIYASEIHLVRENTGETIVVYLTSNATDNRVWRVVYNNDVNDIEGAHEKFQHQWESKVLAFWQGVLDKYGAPNSGSDRWISSTNSYDPMMVAYYGALDLQDKGALAKDKTTNYQYSRSTFKAKPYAF
ncbi:MAG: hypothetical protein IKL14_02530 [Alphaproteobacteria bacterium]|nr:hypothetical protein [Alphaproteobacteria bacterium]